MTITAGKVQVYLEGHTTQFSKAMQRAAAMMEHDIPSAAARASRAMGTFGSSSAAAFDVYKSKSGSAARSLANFGMASFDASSGVGLLTTALVAAGAAFKGFDMAKTSAQFADARTVFAAAGHDIEEFRKATKGLLSDKALITKFNYASQLGVTKDAFMELANVADAAAKKMGISQEYAFESLITGSVRASKPILDNVGIMIDAEKVHADYAKSIGKTADSLTEAEEKQAYLNEVVRQGRTMIADVAGVGATASDVYDKWDASTENLSTSFGLMLHQLGETSGVVNGLVSVVQGLVDVFDGVVSGSDEGTQSLMNFAAAGLQTIAVFQALNPFTAPISGISWIAGEGIGGGAIDEQLERTNELREEIAEITKQRDDLKANPMFDSRDANQVATLNSMLRDMRAELESIERTSASIVVPGAEGYSMTYERGLGGAPGAGWSGGEDPASSAWMRKLKDGREKLRRDRADNRRQARDDLKGEVPETIVPGATVDLENWLPFSEWAKEGLVEVDKLSKSTDDVFADIAQDLIAVGKLEKERIDAEIAHQETLATMAADNIRREQAANAAMAASLAEAGISGRGFAQAGAMAGSSLGAMASVGLGDPSGLLGGAIGGALGGGLGALVDALPHAMSAGAKLAEIATKLIAPFDRLFKPLSSFAGVLSVVVDRALVPFLEKWSMWAGAGIEFFMRLATVLLPIVDLLLQFHPAMMLANAAVDALGPPLSRWAQGLEAMTVAAFTFANQIIDFLNKTFGTKLKKYDVEALMGNAADKGALHTAMRENAKELLKHAIATRESTEALTESSRNTPTGFRVEAYRFDAQGGGSGGGADMPFAGFNPIVVNGDIVIEANDGMAADELADVIFGEAQTRAAQQRGNPLADHASGGKPRRRRRR